MLWSLAVHIIAEKRLHETTTANHTAEAMRMIRAVTIEATRRNRVCMKPSDYRAGGGCRAWG